MSGELPIRPGCRAARESLVELLDRTGRLSASAAPKSFHCAACEAWFQRCWRQARALGALPRLQVEPKALAGRVVAELNAGCRQERAADALTHLERVGAPRELDALVGESFGRMSREAPGELDQRVAAELLSGAGLRAERQLSALARFAAPAELERRVARDLAASAHIGSLPGRRWLALAAAILVLIGAASLVRLVGWGQRPSYPFRVVHSESTASLDPFARSLLSGVSGGSIEVAPRSSDAR